MIWHFDNPWSFICRILYFHIYALHIEFQFSLIAASVIHSQLTYSNLMNKTIKLYHLQIVQNNRLLTSLIFFFDLANKTSLYLCNLPLSQKIIQIPLSELSSEGKIWIWLWNGILKQKTPYWFDKSWFWVILHLLPLQRFPLNLKNYYKIFSLIS